MNNEITPERLKGLAEAMGKEFRVHEESGLPYVARLANHYTYYQPQKDWNQCGGLEEWLFSEDITLMVTKGLDGSVRITAYKPKMQMIEIRDQSCIRTGKTLAALAYVESKNPPKNDLAELLSDG